MKFQKEHGLAADGAAGKKTIAALRAALQAKAAEPSQSPAETALPEGEPSEEEGDGIFEPGGPSGDGPVTLVIYDLPRAEAEALMAAYPRAEIVRG